MGQLTTHVLDIASGIPARGLRIELSRLPAPARIASVLTGDDGRCAKPLLEGDAFQRGEYELAFHVGAYFRGRGEKLPDPAFLEIVVIHFGIADAGLHYHVPLLVTPWSYSTYRGS
jgi:5-hydroxyisourate hydrolase